jgi:hypothetical protein
LTQGWSGFALPILPNAIRLHKGSKFRPKLATGLKFDGNIAHSTGWWWIHAGAFYLSGDLYYNARDKLEYNPGRETNTLFDRDPCAVDPCGEPSYTCDYCPETGWRWFRLTNTKTFLTAGVGLNSWTGRLEIIKYESHDSRLSLEAISDGFWMDNALVVCRTGEALSMPSNNAYNLEATGFVWYDTSQEHIMTRATFRNCGIRSDEYSQYDDSPTRGCDPFDGQKGCRGDSTVFRFPTFSDQFTPQVKQGTKEIYFEHCGRRFGFSTEGHESVSGRGLNWLDNDGSVSGLWEPTIIGSGLESVKNWWRADNECKSYHSIYFFFIC